MQSKLPLLEQTLLTVAMTAVRALVEKYDPEKMRSSINLAWHGNKTYLNDTEISVDDLRAINYSDLRRLGFGEFNGKLVLVPLWTLCLIKNGETLEATSGKIVTVGQDKLDLTTRFGCIDYGFRYDPTTTRSNVILFEKAS